MPAALSCVSPLVGARSWAGGKRKVKNQPSFVDRKRSPFAGILTATPIKIALAEA
jgi:hypothetical protein